MLPFSEVSKYRLAGPGAPTVRVVDLAVDLSLPEPPVTGVVVRAGRAVGQVSGDIAPDRRRRQIRVDRAAYSELPADGLDRLTLLGRDILDALVLDLVGRRAARANDLWLDESGGALRLVGVEVGVGAIVRRLTRGRLGRGPGPDVIPWADVEFLRGDPGAARAGRDYHRQLGRLRPAEIARLLANLPYIHAAEALMLLPEVKAADVFEAMGVDRQLQVLDELDRETLAGILGRMAPDLAAALFRRLDPDRTLELLEALPEPQAGRVRELLGYPPDTAGGIMTNEFLTVNVGLTAGEARSVLKADLRAPDFVYFVYVVADGPERRLVGAFTLRDLLAADDGCPVSELMARDLEVARVTEPADRAAWRVIDNGLAAVPVVDDRGRLVGVVTFDAAVARLAPQAWRTQAPRVFG